jgi:hypothetical protein
MLCLLHECTPSWESGVKQYHYRGITFNVPDIVEGDSIVFNAEGGGSLVSHTIEQRRTLNSIGTIWDFTEFNKIRHPLPIVSMQLPMPTGLRILEMPIKFPNSDYRLPGILKPFEKIIRQVANIEASSIKNANAYYCYLTVDEKILTPGRFTRNLGCHVDGFQGSRITTKHIVDHSYIMVDNTPTLFYNQPFNCAHLRPDVHNFFKYWDAIAKAEHEMTIIPNMMYFMDAYTVHRAPQFISSVPMARTFIRLSFCVREFDRLGNTHNPMFNYDWEMVPRKTAETLI